MKQKNYQRWSRPLLLTLLSVFMAFSGASSAWADAYTCGFETSEGWGQSFGSLTAVGTGWSNVGGLTDFKLSSTYAKTGSYGVAWYDQNSSSATNTTKYLITPKLAAGTISFWAKGKSDVPSCKVTFYTCDEDGGNRTQIFQKYGDTGGLSTSITEYSFTLESNSHLAILISKAGIDDFTAENGLYVESAIPIPTSFSATSTTYNSATFSWTNGGEETEWQIAYKAGADFNPTAEAGQTITSAFSDKPYTLTGLSESTTYYAYLRAKTGEDVSSWSNKVTFTTPAQYLAPTELIANSVTATSATLGWTKNGEETAWQIVYDTDANFVPGDATPVAASTNPFELTGLSPETTYYAYVRAKIGETTFSAWSNKISFTTTELYPRPTALTTTSVGATSATLSWTKNGEETAWDISYSTSSGSPNTGTIVENVTNPYTITTGLTANTTYYVYVRAHMGNGDTSGWSTVCSFTTSYGIPFTQEFGSSSMPTGWTKYSGNMDNVLAGTATLTANGGSWSMANRGGISGYHPVLNLYSTYSGWLVTPAVELTTNNQVAFKLAYSKYNSTDAATGGTNNRFAVLITTDNGENWTKLAEWNNAGTDRNLSAVSTSGDNIALNLSTYNNSTVRIAFYAENSASGGDNDIHFDDVSIGVAPAVLQPSGLAYDNVKFDRAELSWTANGDETDWQLSYSTTETFDPSTEGTIVDADENPFTLTGLSESTTYYVYVRAKKDSDVSDWCDTKVSFSTPEQYPTPSALVMDDYTTTSVTLSWTNGSNETAWEIKYDTNTDFDPATEGTLVAANSNPFEITGLTAETTYYAYVRAKYGVGQYSQWSNKVEMKPSAIRDFTVNDGSDTNSNIPVYGLYTDEGTNAQFIIPASTLTSMQNKRITKLTFYSSDESADWGAAEFEVYLGDAANTSFSAKEFENWSNLTKVYNAAALSVSGNKMEITLNTPFEYIDGNLMIGFKETTIGSYKGLSWYGVNAASYTALYNYNGGALNYVQFLPKVTFTTEPGAPTSPELTVDPASTLAFGIVYNNTTSRTITISNTGTATMTNITAESSDEDVFTVTAPTSTMARKASQEITVTMVATTPGTYNKTITIDSDETDPVVINVSGTYVSAPEMSVYNDSEGNEVATNNETKNFGYVANAPTYTYYIKNTGAGQLDITVSDAGFTVSPTSANLTSGQQQAFTITASAESDGTITFTGKDHSDNSDVATFSVSLEGEVMSQTGKFFEDFAYAAGDETPDATTTELTGWEINNSNNNLKFYHSVIYYYASSTSSSDAANIITPKVHVSSASDILRLSGYVRSVGYYDNSSITLSYSADKSKWTVLGSKTKSDFDAEFELKEFEFSGIPEGNWFLKIEIGNAAVDYVYGFSTTLPAAVTLNETSDNTGLSEAVRDVEIIYTKAAEKWGTIALPFATTTEELGTVYGTTVNAYQMKSYDGSNLVFENTETLEAGKPYVIYAPDEMSGTKTFYNKNITATTAGYDEKGTGSTVTFQATYAPIAAPNMEGKYGVTPSGKVQIGGSSASLKALRGYLTTSAGAHLNIIIDDETTGIKTLLRADDFENGDIYNLKGQKVEKAHKGLYIVNGRKVVVK